MADEGLCTKNPEPVGPPSPKTKFGATSIFQSVTVNANKLDSARFVIRIPDATGDVTELRFFSLEIQESQVGGGGPSTFSFKPVNKVFGILKKADFTYSLKEANLVYNGLNGFWIANTQIVAYYKTVINSDSYTLQLRQATEFECTTNTAVFVQSISPIMSFMVDDPEQFSVFLTFSDGNTQKKISGFGFYNLRTDRYTCDFTKGSEAHSLGQKGTMVLLQKTDSDDHHKLKYYKIKPSSYLVIDYDAITDKTGKVNDIEFKVTSTLNQQSTSSFTIKVAAFQNYQDSVRASVSRPVINSYPEEWVTLPFRSYNLAGNDPTFVLKQGETHLDATNSRVIYKDNVEITFQLPNETTESATKTYTDLEFENMIVVDNNTFIVTKG